MPKSKAVDAGHGVFTDHAILRDPKKVPKPKDQKHLVSFLGTADDRALGIAYAEAGDPRAAEYLAKAKPSDAEVLLRLAVIEKDPSRAAILYQATHREQPTNTTALVNLGVLYAQSNRPEEAAALWKRALQTNPAIEGVALNLAQILPKPEAQAVLERYLIFNPGATAVKARLSALTKEKL